MLHGSWRWSASVVACAIMSSALVACGGGPATQSAGHVRAAATAGSLQRYQLYTHCGINEARIGNHYFEAVHPLSDGQGNPPPGWGNPYQPGTMTLLSPAMAVFRDQAGHHVRFRLRRGATEFEHVCS
jgi:hypothetical protein